MLYEEVNKRLDMLIKDGRALELLLDGLILNERIKREKILSDLQITRLRDLISSITKKPL